MLHKYLQYSVRTLLQEQLGINYLKVSILVPVNSVCKEPEQFTGRKTRWKARREKRTEHQYTNNLLSVSSWWICGEVVWKIRKQSSWTTGTFVKLAYPGRWECCCLHTYLGTAPQLSEGIRHSFATFKSSDLSFLRTMLLFLRHRLFPTCGKVTSIIPEPVMSLH